MLRSLSIKSLIQISSRYLQEIVLCFQMGANFSSRLRLAIATLQFHIRNGLNSGNPETELSSNSYQIQLGEHLINLSLRTFAGDIFVFHEIFLNKCYYVPEFR